MPSLTIHLPPQDHTRALDPAAPTPQSMLADNDLAVGKVVEAISKSKFWPKTCVFVNEDDPQNGFDHVDGHRSLCLVVSLIPSAGKSSARFNNQTSVLHTMELMLGLPPMNQFDAMSPVMRECFDAKADLAAYAALPNKIPLDEMNPKDARKAARPANGR